MCVVCVARVCACSCHTNQERRLYTRPPWKPSFFSVLGLYGVYPLQTHGVLEKKEEAVAALTNKSKEH